MKKMIITLMFISLFSLSANAEYRVYQYYVKSQNRYSMDREAYLITSTMNPVTYQAYHGGADSIDIDLVRTWSCPGDTSQFKKICPSPLEVMEKGQNSP
ncbi:MAG: hypothetical protein CO099_10535 [Bdellovibrio sp. CG_4_9_14_3_um_filter_39_7]|nr:MAG: hypothetical protein CO099_10535 [Bdellovibrio sp. CG_4_9_14_3_um_filter_39_7]